MNIKDFEGVTVNDEYRGVGGMLAPGWFENVVQDKDIATLRLSDIPDHCPSTLQLLANQMVPGMFVAGGSCMTIFDKFHRFGDIDVWVNSDEAYLHVKQLMDIWGFHTSSRDHEQLQEFGDGFTVVQVIRAPMLKSLEDLISTFDIRACRVGFDDKKVAFNTYTKTDIENKALMFDSVSKDAAKLLFRIIKYTSKGFKVTPHQIRDIWNKNKETPNVTLTSGPLSNADLADAIQKMLQNPSLFPPMIPAGNPYVQPYIGTPQWSQPPVTDPYGTVMPVAVPYTYTSGTFPTEKTCWRCGSTGHSGGSCY